MVRVGIRAKILALNGVGFAVLLAISAGVQVLAHQAGTEFETRLNQYYAVQSLRVSLSALRHDGEEYLREPSPEGKAALEAAVAALPAQSEKLSGLEGGPGEVAFRATAARRGLTEYLRRLPAGVAAAESRATDAYQRYLAADRVAGYVDQYLALLLSAALQDGTQWYKTSSARSEIWGRVALAANVGALVGATLLTFWLAGSLSRPISRLALVSERLAAGDLDVEPVTARTGDEIEVLAKSFSTMSQNLRELIVGLQEKALLEQKVHRDELALLELDRDLKESRFYALQSRIRPHFLFNALNTVARSALLEGATQTEQLTHRLAALMRYSLGAGHPFVTLGEELGIVREYLQFQAIRFGARLTWRIDADPEVETVLLPRFTLQPLVENAVLHGIEPRVAGGWIAVVARVRPDRFKIAVADGGAGMESPVLHKVRDAMRGRAASDEGVGVASLDSRLAYRYGDGVRTALYSRPGRGTLLIIVLPRGGTSHDDPDR